MQGKLNTQKRPELIARSFQTFYTHTRERMLNHTTQLSKMEALQLVNNQLKPVMVTWTVLFQLLHIAFHMSVLHTALVCAQRIVTVQEPTCDKI